MRAPPPGSWKLRPEGLIPAGEDPQDGIDDVVHQRVGDGAESAADDDAHRQVQDIAPGNKLFEFGDEAFGFGHRSNTFHVL